MLNELSSRWLKMAVVYFVIGVGLGIYMGSSHQFTLMPVHAHVNLLGWVSMVLFGVLHQLFPQQLNNKIAVVQFWIYQLTLPVLSVALALMLRGNAAIEPVVGIASMGIGIAVLLFAFNVLTNLRPQRRGLAAAE
ncbi:MAG: cytochrome-c oxidase [Pseudomonadota bacterium]